MKDIKNLILKFMNEENYVPMKAKEMASIFMVPKNEYNKFKLQLDELENELKIQKNRKNRYTIVTEKYIEGKYKGNEKGFGFILLDDEEDIFISKENKKGAVNEDVVLVKIINEKAEGKRREGKIVKIVKHNKNELVGTFKKSRNFGFVIPDDKKFGGDIFISKKDFLKAKDNQKVLVKITKYPEKNKKAEGKIIEVIGKIDEAGVDMLSIIKEYKLPYEFPKEVLKEAKEISQLINEKEIKNRVDLRNKKNMNIFTIDGEDAKDLDDAIHVEKKENGNYKLDVHIADVSYYVKKGSNIDIEAIHRGTSIYMFDRVIPMLPFELSNGICSLKAGEDRYTLSCFMEIDSNGYVIDSNVCKAIIRVNERMTYTNVNKILNNLDKKVTDKYKKYIDDFKLMEELANILKNRREKNGYLNLDIPESKIILDNKGKVVDVKKYETTFANEIIEQFMLTANETIAEKFYWLNYPFIYRVHENPDIDKIKELNKFLWNFGYKIHINQDKVHSMEFAKILKDVKGKPEEKVVSNLVLRTLKLAKYEKENNGHFGIGSKYYCHFTSPIRRYPDLFIHRIISEYINSSKQKQKEFEQEAEKYAKTSSECEQIATKAEREAEDMKKAEYMESKIGNEYEGIVSSITSFGIFVELENTIEGLIRYEDLGDEYFIYDDNKKQAIGEKTKETYNIGDKIKIQVVFASKELRQIDFKKMN